MKEMIKNAAILFMITLIAGLVLGFVYENTKGIIADRELADKKASYKEVFPEASDFVPADNVEEESVRRRLDNEGFSKEFIDELNIAKDSSGNTIGYVYTVRTSEGYGGDIVFTMGIKNDGTVNGIAILSSSETAGLGMEADKVLKPQFANKQVSKFVYTKTGAVEINEVDAISGATITTNAITNGVNAALYHFQNIIGGAVNE